MTFAPRNDEHGFTLVELLVVIAIIGILLAIAIPSYVGFKDRANQRSADADVRSSVPTAEAYYADHGSYSAMNLTSLAAMDQGIKIDSVKVGPSSAGYCLMKTVGGKKAHVSRGAGMVKSGNVVEGSTC